MEAAREMGKRTVYSGSYKAKIVIELLRGEKQLGEIAAREGLNPTMLARWRQEFEENASRVFDENRREQELKRKEQELERDRDELLKTVGQLTLERDWLKKKSVEAFGFDYEKKFSPRP